MSPQHQAWWCTDAAHLVYSALVSVWAVTYVVREPAALRLTRPPADITEPSIVVAASAGA